MQFEPFAVQLYRRFAAGRDEYRISLETGIPVDRVRPRLRAAAIFLRERDFPGGRNGGRSTQRTCR